MQSSDAPKKISIAFARDGDKRDIPNESQIGVINGAASFPTGFPPLTFIAKENGGIPPDGEDFNGVLYMLSNLLRYTSSGGIFKFDSTQAQAIGGYPKGAFLLKADESGMWRNTVDNNISNPDAAGAGWVDVNSWIQGGTGAVQQSYQESFRRLSVCPRQFGAKGDGIADDTMPVNACCLYAQINRLTVEPSDGVYLVGNIIFGTQSTTGQSSAPLGLVGKSRSGPIFKAKPGTTGTCLQAWSCSGVRFAHFTVDTTGTTAKTIDWDWKAGVGPSTQNIIYDVRAIGGSAAVCVSMDNLNDTFAQELSVTVSDSSICAISARQTGGLTVLDKCIWNGGYLRIGCQNGIINAGYGMGIEFSEGSVNNLSMPGIYLYPNPSKGGSNFWNASFASGNSVHSLTIGPGAQIITSADNSSSGVLDVSVYSSIVFAGVEFISLGGNIPMWGPNTRADAVQPTAIKFNGGSYSNMITMAEPTNFFISYDGLINKFTQAAYRNSTKNYYARGGNSANFAAATYYELIPQNSLIEGVYILTFKWDHAGAGSPFIVTATALITSPSLSNGIAGKGSDIIASVGEFRPDLQTQIKFRMFAGTDTGTLGVEWWCSRALPSPGAYVYTLTKVA